MLLSLTLLSEEEDGNSNDACWWFRPIIVILTFTLSFKHTVVGLGVVVAVVVAVATASTASRRSQTPLITIATAKVFARQGCFPMTVIVVIFFLQGRAL